MNGKSNNISKQLRKKTSSKNKLNNPINEEQPTQIKIKQNGKNQFNKVTNNNSSNKKLLINEENDNDKIDNNNNNRLFEFKKHNNFPSRPPTQQLIKRYPSPFDSLYNKTEKKFFNLNYFKKVDNIEEIKENNLNKFNKKTNNNFINDLIPFNDIYSKNKLIANNNNYSKNQNNSKIRGNTSELNNMLINHNDFDIFNFKKKVNFFLEKKILILLFLKTNL